MRLRFLNSAEAVRHFGQLANKPSSITVDVKKCAGAELRDVAQVLHARLSTLNLDVCSVKADKDHPNDVLWLRTLQEAKQMKALKLLEFRFLFIGEDKIRLLPRSLARTTLSHHIGANLTAVHFFCLNLSPMMSRWVGRMIPFLKTLKSIILCLCTVLGQFEELICNLTLVQKFTIEIRCGRDVRPMILIRNSSQRQINLFFKGTSWC